MSLGAVTAVSSVVGGLLTKGSPRYGGSDGPLFSTVNGFIDRVVTGDLAVLRQLDQLRKTDAGRVAWQKVWDEMVPIQPLTEAQVRLILQLDPSKSGLVAHGGSPIYAQPGVAVPSLQDVLQGIQHTVEAVNRPAPPDPIGNPLSIVRASSGGLPLWVLVGGGALAAYFVYKAMKKG
jgi:hypothetical protein